MKKYQKLTCTKCHRDIDKLVNITHYAPDRCTITQDCEGRLLPKEYRSSAGIAVSPEPGIIDWQPRTTEWTPNRQAPSVAIRPPEMVGLATGLLGQVVVASPADAATLSLEFEVKADAPKAYRAYIFRKEGAFTTVSGVESGLEKKALRFTAHGATPDMVEVYLGGVKQEPGTDYTVADGSATSAAPPNTIVFTRLIDNPGVTQVDVIVSKEEPSTTRTLTFRRNTHDESRAGTGAYENVAAVEVLGDAWRTLNLYTLDLTEADLPLNTILVPRQADVMLLLARRPYTQLDRYATLVLPLESLNPEVEYLKYHAVDGAPTLQATRESLSQIFPPLRLRKFSVERPIATHTAGVEEQLVIDGKVITGPDA